MVFLKEELSGNSKKMKQWSLRITAYSERLLRDLDLLDWSESIKEMQRNWIGKSEGLKLSFEIHGLENQNIEIFTTRPDTIFGVSFIVIAPESIYTEIVTTTNQQKEIHEYCARSAKKVRRTDRLIIKNTPESSQEVMPSTR